MIVEHDFDPVVVELTGRRASESCRSCHSCHSVRTLLFDSLDEADDRPLGMGHMKARICHLKSVVRRLSGALTGERNLEGLVHTIVHQAEDFPSKACVRECLGCRLRMRVVLGENLEMTKNQAAFDQPTEGSVGACWGNMKVVEAQRNPV